MSVCCAVPACTCAEVRLHVHTRGGCARGPVCPVVGAVRVPGAACAQAFPDAGLRPCALIRAPCTRRFSLRVGRAHLAFSHGYPLSWTCSLPLSFWLAASSNPRPQPSSPYRAPHKRL